MVLGSKFYLVFTLENSKLKLNIFFSFFVIKNKIGIFILNHIFTKFTLLYYNSRMNNHRKLKFSQSIYIIISKYFDFF